MGAPSDIAPSTAAGSRNAIISNPHPQSMQYSNLSFDRSHGMNGTCELPDAKTGEKQGEQQAMWDKILCQDRLQEALEQYQRAIGSRHTQQGTRDSARSPGLCAAHERNDTPRSSIVSPKALAENLIDHEEGARWASPFALKQNQHDANGIVGNPNFMAGYALGMQQAHGQALEHVKKTGALEMSVLTCQQELRRIERRERILELTFACGVGRVGSSLDSLRQRLVDVEEKAATEHDTLHRTMMRLEALEARTPWFLLSRLLRRVLALAWRGYARLLSSEVMHQHEFVKGRGTDFLSLIHCVACASMHTTKNAHVTAGSAWHRRCP
jgi:hypothetical protein